MLIVAIAFLRYSLVLLGLGEVSCLLWTAETEYTACRLKAS